MGRNNQNLRTAKGTKNDEFYTQLTDIEKEMSHYKDFFKGKVVYCNCDDPRDSNFFKYFSLNFEFLGLKKLITTGYKPTGKGVVYIYEGDKNNNRKVDDAEVVVKELNGSGDFRSDECIEFLKEADVVVTNPPFSLFREYIKQLMDYNKKFIVIGNGNAASYKEIFPYIKNNKLWLGAGKGMGGKAMEFVVSEELYDPSKGTVNRKEDGVCYVSVMMCTWFTNVEHKKRHTPLDLYRRYSNEYPKYDNYDAIEVSRVENIPMDYDGLMGVPISFLDKYCPEQFEIVGFFNNYKPETAGEGQIYGEAVKVESTKSLFRGPVVNGKATYFRILIRKRTA